MDEQHRKGNETRRRNSELRRQRQEQRAAEVEKDRALIIPALRRIIANPDATPAQQLAAIDRLAVLKDYPIPTAADSDRLIREFSAELGEYMEAHKEN